MKSHDQMKREAEEWLKRTQDHEFKQKGKEILSHLAFGIVTFIVGFAAGYFL